MYELLVLSCCRINVNKVFEPEEDGEMDAKKIKQAVVSFIKDEEGLTMVEYAVAGALVTLGAVAAFTTLGTNIGTSITKLASCVVGDTSVCK